MHKYFRTLYKLTESDPEQHGIDNHAFVTYYKTEIRMLVHVFLSETLQKKGHKLVHAHINRLKLVLRGTFSFTNAGMTCPCNIDISKVVKNFQWKKIDIFNILAQNIHCGYSVEPPRRGGSNGYPQCMFWMKNKKIRYTPANPCFAI